jgi:DNA-directed RNA polymerase subunit H (RpoH/RPB5)
MTWRHFQQAYSEAASVRHVSVRSIMTQIRKVGDAVAFTNTPKTYVNPLTSQRLVVYFSDMDKTKLGVDEFNEFISFAFPTKPWPETAILVSPGKLSKNAKDSLDKMVAHYIQVFREIELVMDPTEHWLVPKHEILSVDEVATTFPADFNIDDLQVIKQSDPISRYLGARQGDIIRIHRFNMGSLYMTSDVSTFTRKYTAFRIVRELDLKNIEMEGEEGEGGGGEGGAVGTSEVATVHEL